MYTASCPQTHVEHKPSGKQVPIPGAVHVDNTWTFKSHWSDSEAELVDSDGWGRPVSSFLPLPELSMTEWIDFANRTAAGLEANPEGSEAQTISALNIVAHHLALRSAQAV